MKRIAYTTETGSTSICVPHIGFRNAYKATREDGTVVVAKEHMGEDFCPADRLIGFPWPEATVFDWAETEEEFVARVRTKDVPTEAAPVVFVDPAEVPQSRVFRDAWVIQGEAVVVSMEKARGIHLGKIRIARNERLAALDGPWMRAMGRGLAEEADEIERRREALRNLPQTLDLEAFETPEELAEFWPEVLR